MPVIGGDPFDVLLYQQGQIGTPLVEGAAAGSDPLDVAQRGAVVGEVIPIVFCRRVSGVGGVLISPPATEARFENSLTNEVTASYHLVISEGVLEGIQVRDVFQRSCRVGSFTQTYSRRAGPWTRGNFIVTRAGYTKPECPYYCGTGGTYEGMTTGSFVIAGVPNGDTRWNRQVHLFIRGGLKVTRLLDATFGSSNNFADLILYLLQETSRTPAALISTPLLTNAASFTDQLGFWFNGELKESGNLEDFIAAYGRYFLLAKTKKAGLIGLRPLLPVRSDQTVNTGPLRPVFTFDESWIIPGSFEISYIPLADRKPFCCLMLWRQQPDDDIGLIRTTEVRYPGTAVSGPYEQHDLSGFCCSELHAVRVGAYILARRRYITHTLRIKARPGSFNATLAQGDIVRVRMPRTPSSAAAGVHDYLYEVDRIGQSRTGEITLNLTHCPVDSTGSSLVAQDVMAAFGGGLTLSTGKTGTSCDVNSSADTSVPADDSLDPSNWTLPDPDAFDGTIPEVEPGGLDDGGGGAGSPGDGDAGSPGDGDPVDSNAPRNGPLDLGRTSGGVLTVPSGVCSTSPANYNWLRDGSPIDGATGSSYTLTPADAGKSIVGRTNCTGGGHVDSNPVVPMPYPEFPDRQILTYFWRVLYASRTGGAQTEGESFQSRGLPVITGTIPVDGTALGWEPQQQLGYYWLVPGERGLTGPTPAPTFDLLAYVMSDGGNAAWLYGFGSPF